MRPRKKPASALSEQDKRDIAEGISTGFDIQRQIQEAVSSARERWVRERQLKDAIDALPPVERLANRIMAEQGVIYPKALLIASRALRPWAVNEDKPAGEGLSEQIVNLPGREIFYKSNIKKFVYRPPRDFQKSCTKAAQKEHRRKLKELADYEDNFRTCKHGDKGHWEKKIKRLRDELERDEINRQYRILYSQLLAEKAITDTWIKRCEDVLAWREGWHEDGSEMPQWFHEEIVAEQEAEEKWQKEISEQLEIEAPPHDEMFSRVVEDLSGRKVDRDDALKIWTSPTGAVFKSAFGWWDSLETQKLYDKEIAAIEALSASGDTKKAKHFNEWIEYLQKERPKNYEDLKLIEVRKK